MEKKEYWGIIKDDKAKTFCIAGLISDDTQLTNLTCEMQAAGLQVRCETLSSSVSKEKIVSDYAAMGYFEDSSLMSSLKIKLDTIVKTAPKK